MRKILLSPDPTPGGEPPSPNPAPVPGPAAPPAAKTVVTGAKTEREITLEAELETERSSHAKTAKEKKDRELKIAELEDSLHRLKSVPTPEKKSSLLDISEFFE